MRSLTTRIVCRAPQANDLHTRFAELPRATTRPVSVHVFDGDVEQAVAALRERFPREPLGVLVADDGEVLAALHGGADDANVLELVSSAPLTAFLDRVELRAELRGAALPAHERAAHSEKLTALGTLVAGVGHEINNPLTALMLTLEFAEREVLPLLEAAGDLARAAARGGVPPADAVQRLLAAWHDGGPAQEAARLLGDIGTAASAIASVVGDLRAFARSDDADGIENVDVEELVDHALRLVSRSVLQHVPIERDYGRNLPVIHLQRNRLLQVLMNILINAGHALREVKRSYHRVRITLRCDEGFIAISISDSGRGIPSDELERIFDPFYTTKREQSGSGLGLTISRAIMRRIGGELSVASLPGEGATFVCLVPVPSASTGHPGGDVASIVVTRSTQPAAPATSQVALRLLHVDSEPARIRAFLRLVPRRHRVLSAHSKIELLELLEAGAEPDVIFIDTRVAGARAIDAWLAQNRPAPHPRLVLLEREPGRVPHVAPARADVLYGELDGEALTQLLDDVAGESAAPSSPEPAESP